MRALVDPRWSGDAITDALADHVTRSRLDRDPSAVLELAGTVADRSACAVTAFSDRGTREPCKRPCRARTGFDEQVADILLVGLPPSPDLRFQVTTHGIDVERDYTAFRVRPAAGQSHDALAALLRIPAPRRGGGALTELDGDLVGFTTRPLPAVEGVTTGVGPPRSLDRMPESYRLAGRAVDVATAFGLTGVHSVDSLGLLPTVLADGDIGEALELRYLTPLFDADPAGGLRDALRAYFDCGMHVDRTAKALLLHPNTLRQRLSRFEELSGARLRDPVAAMEVWWALRHAALAARRTLVTTARQW